MAIRLSCRHGHQWDAPQAASESSRCPTCGAAAQPADATPPPAPALGETVAIPANPDSSPADDRAFRSLPAEPAAEAGAGVGPVVFDSDPNVVLAATQLSAEPPRLEPGRLVRPTLPGYEVVGELGRGGMGVVYKARHEKLKRLVALKMILSGVHAGADDLARFRTEAEAAARLQHANIVQIYEVGEHEGRPYFALEYVEGGSLEERLEGKPMHAPTAARLVEQLARAMHYAHERGIVHRDLKPANVLLASSRESSASAVTIAEGARPGDAVPKITDFGLAKKLDEAGSHTRTGSILGTPSYMAPEQAEGRIRDIGPLTDVYSLGAILYEALTGRPPFCADSPLETMRQVSNAEPVSPRSLQPNLPRDLDTICLKCLEKQPRKRYPSALELARDLRRFLDGEPVLARPTPAWERSVKWARRRPATAAILAAAVVGGAALLVVGGVSYAAVRAAAKREALRAAEAEEALAQSRERQVRLTVARGASLLDDGDLLGALPWLTEALTLERGRPDREALHRLRIGAVLRQSPRLVQVWFHAGRVNDAEFSPDGSQVVTASDDRTAQLWDPVRGARAQRPLRHDGPVLRARFSPDSHKVVTASADGTARVWDARNCAPLGAPLKHAGPVLWAAFSPDSSHVLTAGADGVAQVWDLRATQPVGRPLKHPGAVNWAGFSPDGKRVLTAGADGAARLWDWAKGALIGSPMKHADAVQAAAFSPVGRRVATAGADGAARVWDAATGEPVTPWLRHAGPVLQIAFSPDGRLVATASADQTARLWDATSGAAVGLPMRHGSKVYSVAFGPAGRRLATASDDNTARVWDGATGEPISPPLRHNGTLYWAAFCPDGRRVVTASQDGSVHVWDPAGGQAVVAPLRHGGPVTHLAYCPDGRHVITASADRTAVVWNVHTGRESAPPLQHAGPVLRVAVSRDGRHVATASEDGAARVWDVISGDAAAPPLRHRGPVLDVAFSPNGRLVATASKDGTAQVWDASTGKPTTPPLAHEGPVNAIAFSPDGTRLATAGDDRLVRLWEVGTGAAVGDPLRHAGEVLHVAYAPDGSRLLSASADRTAQLWDAATGTPAGPPLRHGSKVVHAEFHAEGHRVVTASDDNTARVWDADTGRPLTPPLHHHGSVRYATFSPDGRLVATASEDRTARVWDATTGEPITPLFRHQGAADCVAFSPDGTQVITAGAWAAWPWQLVPEERSPEDLGALATLLVGGQIDATGGLVPLERDALRAAWQELRPRHPSLFQTSPEEVLAWHRREGEACEASRQWFAAVWHLDRLLAADPDSAALRTARGQAQAGLGDLAQAVKDFSRAINLDPKRWEAWLGRGEAYARLRQWDRAAADFTRNRDVGPDDPHVWHWHALALLAAGDVPGYRAASADLLDRFGRSADLETARQAAWSAALAPEGTPDPNALVAFAERVSQARPKEAAALLTAGACLYRAGRFEAAHERLRTALAANGNGVSVPAQLLLAMTSQRLGRADEALDWLKRARQTAAGEDRARRDAGVSQPWDQEIERALLLAEADKLVITAEPSP